MDITIGVAFEKKENPYYNDIVHDAESALSELVKPEEINKINEALRSLGYRVEEIDGPIDLIQKIDMYKDQNSIIFNKCRGFSGLERKIFIPSICSLYKIPMVGSSAYVVTLARHKFHSNRLVSGLGIKVPNAKICYIGEHVRLDGLEFPVIVKPNHESGALGISEKSVNSNSSTIKESIRALQKKFKQHVIVEEFIDGEEWKIPVIGNHPNSAAVGCVGVMKKGKPIIGSLQTRSDLLKEKIEYYQPRKSNLVIAAMKISTAIHDAFQCNDYSRCDFRINRNNELVFMELSTHPDISQDSSFINAAIQTYNNYDNVIESVVNSSLKRCGIKTE